MAKKKKAEAVMPVTGLEWWSVVQVASFCKMKYQDARNAMLEGRYGASEYDAKTRRLTVRADLVHADQERRAQRRKQRANQSRSRSARR